LGEIVPTGPGMQIVYRQPLSMKEGGLWEPGAFRMWGVPDGH
jgi:hypothetical protein